jgi:hypothetical protein
MGSSRTYVVAMPPIFVCEQCWGRIRNGDGYLRVDTEAAREAFELRNGVRVNWRIFHSDCDPQLTPFDHVVWTRRFSNTNELFLEMANLSERMIWFRATNWQGLVRRVLADTNHYADSYCAKRARKQTAKMD